MKIKCDYCGATYEDTLLKCPQCGAPNPTQKGVTDKTPKTIAELKAWYTARRLPPEETTRFFIGKNISEPRAFGIYQNESGEFVVYKNKDDGTRAIRYRGNDEAYAVNELYQKLKDEIVHQKNNSQRSRSNSRQGERRRKRTGFIAVIAWICIILIIGMVDNYRKRNNGYYNYNSSVYYYDTDTWYSYEDYYDDWYVTTPPEQYDPGNTDPYYMGRTYSDASEWDYPERFSDIRNNEEYQNAHSSSDSDSDYDWDSGSSWDSGSTDWSSDW